MIENQGGQIVAPVTERPTGRVVILRHPDGHVCEYVQPALSFSHL
ncbi:VOC family protein [Brevibacillus dissolubilis]|nr:hypothetical protein [Brevibacillus dissolubilis]